MFSGESFIPKKPAEKSPEQDAEMFEPFDLKFYITDHSADSDNTGSPEKLRELYTDIKKDGIDSVRYDWRWKNIEKNPGTYDQESLQRYAGAKNIMEEAGLKEPTIILSDIPDWAKKLYQEGEKEEFFAVFQEYAEQVAQSLMKCDGGKVSKIQILNELNNKIFTPVSIEDLPKLCQIARAAFAEYNPDIKLTGTLLVSNLNYVSRMGMEINQYLTEFEKIKGSFDTLAVDYYPGVWDYAINRETLKSTKKLFRQMEPLKKVFQKLSEWGVDYELGEVGCPTMKFISNEKKQRYFYDTFFRAFRQMLVEMKKEGFNNMPSRVGFYSAIDEMLTGSIEETKDTIKAGPGFGMRDIEGERKEILLGNRHVFEGEDRGPSQLSRIIKYMNTPVKKG